ncbi:hypothetical protein ACA910_013419 [Epithemia clementina (nom. ined.)]
MAGDNNGSSSSTMGSNDNNKRGDTTKKNSLERDLFLALRDHGVRCPSVKEFDESYAFVNGVRSSLFRHERSSSSSSKPEERLDLVIDVAGGHGAVAALFLILTSAQEACVVDPANLEGGVAQAWSSFFVTEEPLSSHDDDKDDDDDDDDEIRQKRNKKNKKRLRYRHECLRTGLPLELERAFSSSSSSNDDDGDNDEGDPRDDDSKNKYDASLDAQTRPRLQSRRRHRRPLGRRNILVVACHACQHLSEETLQIAYQYGVHCAVLPCCQTDLTPGAPWKAVAHNLNVPFAIVMDLLLAGKAQQQSSSSSSSWQQRRLPMSSTSATIPTTTTTARLKEDHKDNNYDSSQEANDESTVQDAVKADVDAAHHSGFAHYYSYQVRMKVMNRQITPQNRIIVCRALREDDEDDNDKGESLTRDVRVVADRSTTTKEMRVHHKNKTNDSSSHNGGSNNTSQIGSIRQRKAAATDRAHKRLQRAYQKAHQQQRPQIQDGEDEGDTITRPTRQSILRDDKTHAQQRSEKPHGRRPQRNKEKKATTTSSWNFLGHVLDLHDDRTLTLLQGFAMGFVVACVTCTYFNRNDDGYTGRRRWWGNS